ncbi:MAG: hypothetical protein ACR2GU_02610 [Rubrobacteraceae bacterium]
MSSGPRRSHPGSRQTYRSLFGLSREKRDSALRVLVGGVVGDEDSDHLDVAPVGTFQQFVEVLSGAEYGVNVAVCSD